MPPSAPLPGEPPVPTGPRPTTVPPLPTRTPSPTPARPIAPAAPAAPAPVAAGGPAGNGSTPAPVDGNGNGSAPVAAEASAELTSSGLVKRVPRRAGGNRAVPGSDGPSRAPTTTSSRSPDEVRAMLSRFHSGRQAGQAPPTGSSPDPYPSDTHPSDRKET
jgi:hypothetical protein